MACGLWASGGICCLSAKPLPLAPTVGGTPRGRHGANAPLPIRSVCSRCSAGDHSETGFRKLPLIGLRSERIRCGRGRNPLVSCKAQKKANVAKQVGGGEEGGAETTRKVLQVVLWGAEVAYIGWLFLLPYAPGDPVWSISPATLRDLIGLSLNFFFILPILNSVGIHVMEAPVLHPVAEGLFNFVIGWTLMFAPLLFTDYRRDRYKGSLDLLWGMQMFLTNTFLIPYMAIRLNDVDTEYAPQKPSQLSLVMTRGAKVVGIIGGVACLVSAFWFIVGRGGGDYGGLEDRWEFFRRYIGSERLAYAFIWDIILYSIFQPWLIGDNIQNLKANTMQIVAYTRFIPVVGLIIYLLSLDTEREL